MLAMLQWEGAQREKQTGPRFKPMASPCCLPSHMLTSMTGSMVGALLKLYSLLPDPPTSCRKEVKVRGCCIVWLKGSKFLPSLIYQRGLKFCIFHAPAHTHTHMPLTLQPSVRRLGVTSPLPLNPLKVGCLVPVSTFLQWMVRLWWAERLVICSIFSWTLLIVEVNWKREKEIKREGGELDMYDIPFHRDWQVTNKILTTHQLPSNLAIATGGRYIWPSVSHQLELEPLNVTLFCMLIHVAQLSPKSQCTVKASEGWPPFGSIQYMPAERNGAEENKFASLK